MAYHACRVGGIALLLLLMYLRLLLLLKHMLRASSGDRCVELSDAVLHMRSRAVNHSNNQCNSGKCKLKQLARPKPSCLKQHSTMTMASPMLSRQTHGATKLPSSMAWQRLFPIGQGWSMHMELLQHQLLHNLLLARRLGELTMQVLQLLVIGELVHTDVHLLTCQPLRLDPEKSDLPMLGKQSKPSELALQMQHQIFQLMPSRWCLRKH